MRRIKMVLSVATVAVSMLAVSAAPALADVDFDGAAFSDSGTVFFVDGFGFFGFDGLGFDDGAFVSEIDQEATSGDISLSSNVN